MKNRRILFIMLALLGMTLLSACEGEKTYQNIAAQSNPYSMGEQRIEIVASSVNADEPSAKFKQNISPSDVEIGQALEGKTIVRVTYNSETSITVTLDGNTKAVGGDGVYGTITVKQSGMASEGASTCTVNVRVPEIEVFSYSVTRKTVGDVTTNHIIAQLSLPAGTFTDKAVGGVTLTDGATGELTAERTADGTLTLNIQNCNTANPSILLNADATTLEKGVAVKLSLGGSASFQ